MTDQEVLHGPFSIETHKKQFIDYLEVIIDDDGIVHYAVPSHTEWLINKASEIFDLTREELTNQMMETYLEYPPVEFLCKKLKYISMWNSRYVGSCNEKQKYTIKELTDAGLYYGHP